MGNLCGSPSVLEGVPMMTKALALIAIALLLSLCGEISAREIDKDVLVAEEAAIQKIHMSPPAPAPTHDPLPTRSKPKPETPDLYRLKIGDKFAIGLYGDLLTSRQEVEVSPTGTLSYQSARFIPAVGRTIPEVKKDLEEHLKSYYRFPILSLTAIKLVGNHYTVIGEVSLPGVKPLIGHVTILSALSNAGGFSTRIYRDQTIDLVDLDRSFLTRHGKYVPVDFTRLIKEGDLSLDLSIEPGDFLYMATYVMPKVYVVGEVIQATTINYLFDISLAEALAEAGGVTLRASSRVAVIRGALNCPQLYLIDINRLLKGHACNFWLEPGDIVYVPPFRFTHFKDYIEGGIAAFVGELLNIAGTNAFLEVTPKAKGTTIISPSPVITPLNPTPIRPVVGAPLR